MVVDDKTFLEMYNKSYAKRRELLHMYIRNVDLPTEMFYDLESHKTVREVLEPVFKQNAELGLIPSGKLIRAFSIEGVHSQIQDTLRELYFQDVKSLGCICYYMKRSKQKNGKFLRELKSLNVHIARGQLRSIEFRDGLIEKYKEYENGLVNIAFVLGSQMQPRNNSRRLLEDYMNRLIADRYNNLAKAVRCTQ